MKKDPLVKHALVFGAGHFQNGIIVLPSAVSWSPEDFLRAIRPTIDRVNAAIPQHSRLVETLVLVASPEKGFELTDKGTVRRQATLESYDVEINAAYDQLEAGMLAASLPEEGDLDGIKTYIRASVEALLKKKIADDADLFASGKLKEHTFFLTRRC